MSEFSERCKQLIEESGTNIYGVYKNTGLDRTTLQRLVNGTRLPGETFIKKMCKALRTSKIEEEHLLKLFAKEKMGKDAYYKRKTIIEMLKNIKNNHQIYAQSRGGEIMITQMLQQKDCYELNGVEEVYHAIEYAIHREIKQEQHARICMTYSALADRMMQALLACEDQAIGDITVKQYMDFRKKMDSCGNRFNNLEVLKTIVPFAFTFKNKYYAYYSYVNKVREDNHYILWPYHFITSSEVILYSEDIKRGIVYLGKGQADMYRREIEQIIQKCRLLFQPMVLETKTYEFYCKKVLSMRGKETVILESNPCLFKILGNDLNRFIKEKTIIFNHSNRELMDGMIQWINDKNSKITSYFTMEGMHEFMKTGVVPGKYKDIISTIPSEERISLLIKFYQQLKQGEWNGYMVNEEELPLSLGLNIEIYEEEGLFITSMNQEFNLGVIYIEEKSICEAFMEFMRNIHSGDLVYSKEETLKRVWDFIEHYRMGTEMQLC